MWSITKLLIADNLMKKLLIPKVNSINELFFLAETDPRYAQLAIIAARNLGGMGENLQSARQTLIDNATDEEECDEKGVVGEINFCRRLVTA